MFPKGEIKRVYKEVVIATAAGGLTVTLDGRPLRTPAKANLVVPSRPLAEALAEEWAAQEDKVRPASMPLTSLACTAIDIVGPRREETVGEVAAYGKTDLLCYRSEHPPALVAREAEVWQPLLDWAARELEAPLTATTGIVAAPQPAGALASLRRAVEHRDDLSLAALALAVRTSGSLVIGLALDAGRIGPQKAFAAAELHETYQMEAWGEDPEAKRRRDSVMRDLRTAARLLELLR